MCNYFMEISPLFLSVHHNKTQGRLTPSKGFDSKTTLGNGFYDLILNPKVRQIVLTLILVFNLTPPPELFCTINSFFSGHTVIMFLPGLLTCTVFLSSIQNY